MPKSKDRIKQSQVSKAKKETKRSFNKILRGKGTNKDQETVKMVINNYFAIMQRLAEGGQV